MVFWGRRARSCLHPAVGLGDLGAFHWGPRGFPAWSELLAEVCGVGGEGGTGTGLWSPSSQGDARWQPSTLVGLEEGEMLGKSQLLSAPHAPRVAPLANRHQNLQWWPRRRQILPKSALPSWLLSA